MRPSNPDARYVPRDPPMMTPLDRARQVLTPPEPEKPREVGLGTMKIVVEEPEWAARLEAKLDRILRCVDPEAE